MIDTDKYENMRRLFRDFIDTADEDTEDAWKNKLTMLDELLAEVKRLREQLTSADKMIREMIRESRDTPREAYVSGSAREAEQLFVHVLEANWDEVIE